MLEVVCRRVDVDQEFRESMEEWMMTTYRQPPILTVVRRDETIEETIASSNHRHYLWRIAYELPSAKVSIYLFDHDEEALSYLQQAHTTT